MKPLKILIFAAYYLPFRGGYVESIHGLARELKAVGHEVTVVTCKVVERTTDEETIDGVTIHRLPCWHVLKGTYPVVVPGLKAWRLWRRLKRENYDVVSTQTRFFTTSFWGALFAKMNRKPLIHTERGAYHSVVKNPLINLLSRTVDHTLGWWVVRSADRTVAVSKAASQFLNHLHAKNIHIIPNGVNLIESLSKDQKEQLKKKWGFERDEWLLVFVGRLIFAKGVQDLLGSLKKLKGIQPQLKCVVIGDGPYRTVLGKEIEKNRLENDMRFIGELPPRQVIEILQMADCFVNPSHSEGLPRSVLEAAAAGLPMVATDVGGTREIVEHGQSGFLVPEKNPEALAEGLEALLKDKNKAKILGENARKKIQKEFTWTSVRKAYIDLINEVVSS